MFTNKAPIIPFKISKGNGRATEPRPSEPALEIFSKELEERIRRRTVESPLHKIYNQYLKEKAPAEQKAS